MGPRPRRGRGARARPLRGARGADRAKLGNPTHDPHGDPIPTADLVIDEGRSVALDALEPGARGALRARLRRRPGDAALPRRARDRARRRRFEVVEHQPFGGPLFVRFGDETHVLGGELAARDARGGRRRERPAARGRPWRRPRAAATTAPAGLDAETAVASRRPAPRADPRAAGAGAARRAARPGVRRRRRLRRPGQLRHQHRRRRQVRLPAAVGDPRREPDGDAGPVPVGEDRHRDRPQPAGAVPRALPAPPSTRACGCRPRSIAMATDLAEFVGAAIALNLLFGVPLFAAGPDHRRRRVRDPRAADARLPPLRARDRGPARRSILLGFLYDTLQIGFDAGEAAGGFVPSFDGTDSVLLAAGILGATVMPHVIYLHSALTQDRIRPRDDDGEARAAALPARRRDDRDGPRRARQHVDAGRRRVAVPRLAAQRRRHDRGRPRRLRTTWSAAARRSPSRSRCWPRASRPRASARTPARS